MLFRSVISEEIKIQLKKQTGDAGPDYVIACVGGGSNAAGAFYHFLGSAKTNLIGAEAAGMGIHSHETAAVSYTHLDVYKRQGIYQP